jgi:hypothetical protein
MDSKLEFKEGDLVTIKLKKHDPSTLLQGSSCVFDILHIIKHEPAPFDWKDAKQGMAFKNTKTDRIVFFVAPDVTDSIYGVFALNDEWLDFDTQLLNLLTRAPEHDMEVGDDPAKN